MEIKIKLEKKENKEINLINPNKTTYSLLSENGDLIGNMHILNNEIALYEAGGKQTYSIKLQDIWNSFCEALGKEYNKIEKNT
ncbi:MAG: hypothetical protein K9K32_00095 [Halanaerobiales bacterium]|nr:hypothetical protein [Halanaerobiales bacterium]